MREATNAPTDAKITPAFTILSLFPTAILARPPTALHRRTLGMSLTQCMRDHLGLWRDRKFMQLWVEAAPPALPPPTNANDHTDGAVQALSNSRRKLHLARDGDYSRAFQALDSSGLHVDNRDGENTLLAKHPQQTPD